MCLLEFFKSYSVPLFGFMCNMTLHYSGVIAVYGAVKVICGVFFYIYKYFVNDMILRKHMDT